MGLGQVSCPSDQDPEQNVDEVVQPECVYCECVKGIVGAGKSGFGAGNATGKVGGILCDEMGTTPVLRHHPLGRRSGWMWECCR